MSIPEKEDRPDELTPVGPKGLAPGLPESMRTDETEARRLLQAAGTG